MTPPGQPGSVDVEVVVFDAVSAVLPEGFTFATEFRRGDVTADGRVEIIDVLIMLQYLYNLGSVSCVDAADVDDDGRVTVSDPIRLLLYLYSGGLEPAPPFAAPGPDLTDDSLGCERAIGE